MDKLTGEWKNLYNGTSTRFSYSPNVKNPQADNITALHILVAASVKKDADKEKVFSILDIALSIAGVDVNVQDKNGKTPLYWAVELGSFGAFERLLKKGASLILPEDMEYSNLLELAIDLLTTQVTPDRIQIFERLLELTEGAERIEVIKAHYDELPKEAKKLADPYLPSYAKKWKLAKLKMQFARLVKEKVINYRKNAISFVLNLFYVGLKLRISGIHEKDIFDRNQLEVQSQFLEAEYSEFLDKIIKEFNEMPEPIASDVSTGPTYEEFYDSLAGILAFITSKKRTYESTFQEMVAAPPSNDNFHLYLGQILFLMNEWFAFDKQGPFALSTRDFFDNPERFILYETTTMRKSVTEGLEEKRKKVEINIREVLEKRKAEREAVAAAERAAAELRRKNAERREAEAEAARKREQVRLAKEKEEADKKAAKNAKNKKDREEAQERAKRNSELRARLAEQAKKAKEEAERIKKEEQEKLRIAKEALERAEALRKAREEEAKQAAEKVAREEQERLNREAAEKVAREEQERLNREEAERIAREEQDTENASKRGAENASKKGAENTAKKGNKEVNGILEALYNLEDERIGALVDFRETLQNQLETYNLYLAALQQTKNTEFDKGLEEVNKLENDLNNALRKFREIGQDCYNLVNSIAKLYKETQTAQKLEWQGSLAPGLTAKQKIIFKEKNLKYRNHLINLVREFLNKLTLCPGFEAHSVYWRKFLVKDEKAKEIEEQDLQVLKQQNPVARVNPVPKPTEGINDILSILNDLFWEIENRKSSHTLQEKINLEFLILRILRRKNDLPAIVNLDETYMQILLHLQQLENLQEQILSVLGKQKNAEEFKSLPKKNQDQRKKLKMLKSAADYFKQVQGVKFEEPKEEPPKRKEDEGPRVPPPLVPPPLQRSFEEIRTELEETTDRERAVQLINEAIVTNRYDINALDEEGHTLLMIMVVKKFRKAVERLLQLGANANIQDPKGFTALMMAIIVTNPNSINEYGTLITIINLIQRSDTNILDKSGYDAYHFAEELQRRIVGYTEKGMFTDKVVNVLYRNRSYAPMRGLRGLFRGFFGGTKRNRKHADKKSLKRHRPK